MKNLRDFFTMQVLSDERGQTLPWMALLMILFLGMAGLTVDLGRAYVCYRELQASTDSAALAGAYAMTQGGATVNSSKSAACSFSSNTTATGTCPVGNNTKPSMSQVSADPELKCVTPGPIVSASCTAAGGYNVIQVTQTATLPTFFIQALRAFGVQSAQSLTLNTASTAAVQSGGSPGVNIAVVIDTTASMNDGVNDGYCNNTQIYCALDGLRSLLGGLYPCSSGSSAKAGCLGAYDQVSLFTFPNIVANDATDDTTCPTSDPSIPYYSYVPVPSATNTSYTAPTGGSSTYQVTGYEDDYSLTNSANGGLSTTSVLGVAAGSNSTKNCSGLKAPGGDNTFIAGAMYAAITSLQAAKGTNPNTANALILLTDGASNTSKFDPTFLAAAAANTKVGTYPSTISQCQQMAAAGQYATSLGITVYTIAYGASTDPSQCSTDTSLNSNGKPVANVVSPCTALQNTASSPSTFYSDNTSPTAGCTSINSGVGLEGIFTDIGASFLKARLVPNSVTNGS
jgi:Flp pilus assembly protein TadG